MDGLNYNLLYCFHVIASEGSIKAASSKIKLSSSTLSEHLKQLEKQFKHKLFERNKSRLVLSEAGRRMFRYTKIMFKTSERLAYSFTPKSHKQPISIDIGISSSVSRLIAADTLASVFKDPKTHVRIKHADYDYLVRDLLASQIDLLISEQKITLNQSQSIVTELIHQSPLVLVTTTKHVDFLKTLNKSPFKYSFLNYSLSSTYRWEVDKYFHSAEIEANVVGELDDLQLMKSALFAGISYAILPLVIVKNEIKTNKLFLVDTLGESKARVYVSYQKRDPLQQVLQQVTSLKKLLKG